MYTHTRARTHTHTHTHAHRGKVCSEELHKTITYCSMYANYPSSEPLSSQVCSCGAQSFWDKSGPELLLLGLEKNMHISSEYVVENTYMYI